MPHPSHHDISRWNRRDVFDKKAAGLFSRAKRINRGRPNGYVSGRQLKLLLDESGWCCAYCGCPLTLNTVTFDHLTPLARGGKHAASNLAPACRSCNASKGTLTADEYRLYRAVRSLPPAEQAVATKALCLYGLTRLLDYTAASKRAA